MKRENTSREDRPAPGEGPISFLERVKRIFIGPPRNLADPTIFHRISLVAFLAWVGLGADGLSSSAYGPEEAFRTLGEHRYLAVALAVAMAGTVLIISAAYSRIIEQFPHGGGGYVVATKLLGKHAGIVSGGALLVDYMLTITISVAAGGDAFFSFLPADAHGWKIPSEVAAILFLTVLNLRGIRESVIALTPVFILFLVTHAVLIGGGLIAHISDLPRTVEDVGAGFSSGFSTLGFWGLFVIFIHAYSLGGGTYTGIEAVSNGLSIMREPRVRTAQRTMLYMGVSLAVTATGLLVCYLLWNVTPVEGKTMNAVLAEKFCEVVPLGAAFVVVTLIAEAALLLVAAQAGFVGGPRVLANMAVDSWVPRRFAALSDRLTTQNGILLMGVASLCALLYTDGSVGKLVVMYSINVFLTFAISMLGMLRHAIRTRRPRERGIGRVVLFLTGFVMCATILVITAFEKFTEGGWITLAVTGTVILLCLAIRRHYDTVTKKLNAQYAPLEKSVESEPARPCGELDRSQPTAVVLVGGYGGLGIHIYMSIFRDFPRHFSNVVFASVGVIDSREFKGEGTVESLEESVDAQLARYVDLARRMGIPAMSRRAVGTDAVEEGEKLCLAVAGEFPRSTFFAGRVLFGRERWYQNILHNETAFAIQRRLQWAGKTVVVVPARLR